MTTPRAVCLKVTVHTGNEWWEGEGCGRVGEGLAVWWGWRDQSAPHRHWRRCCHVCCPLATRHAASVRQRHVPPVARVIRPYLADLTSKGPPGNAWINVDGRCRDRSSLRQVEVITARKMWLLWPQCPPNSLLAPLTPQGVNEAKRQRGLSSAASRATVPSNLVQQPCVRGLCLASLLSTQEACTQLHIAFWVSTGTLTVSDMSYLYNCLSGFLQEVWHKNVY